MFTKLKICEISCDSKSFFSFNTGLKTSPKRLWENMYCWIWYLQYYQATVYLKIKHFIMVMNGLGWFGKLSNLSQPENFAKALLETGEYFVLGRGGGRMPGEHEPCGSVLSSAIRKSHSLLVCVLKIFITNVDNVRNRRELSLWWSCY